MVDPLTQKYGSRARVLLPLLLVAFVALCAWRMWPRPPELAPVAPPDGAPALTLGGPTMGTTWKVTVVGNLSADEQRAVEDAVARELDEVDRQMSTWRPDSEISRFNAHASTEPFPASRGLLEVVARAAEISAASDGAFDITVPPLLAAWGFGPGGRGPDFVPPDDAQVEALRTRIGWRTVQVDASAGTLRKTRPDAAIELSAIAPGWAADRIAAALTALGHPRHLVDVGGELLATGLAPHGGPWRLGIERPDAPGKTVEEVVLVQDRALATSGDYRNYYERDGVRLSHTLDPRTGRPVAHRLASVSVLHRSAVLADGWATALNVLGPDAGLALAEAQGLPALFLVREAGGGFASRSTTAFATLRPDPRQATLSPR